MNVIAFASMGLNMGKNLLLTRILSAEVLGTMGLIAFWTGMLGSCFGLQTRHYLVRREGSSASVVETAFLLELGWACCGLICAGTVLPGVMALFKRPDLIPLVQICSVVLLTNLFRFFQALLERELKFARAQMPLLAANLLHAAVAVAMALAGYGIWSLISGYVLGQTLLCLTLWRLAGYPLRVSRAKARHARSVLRFSLPMVTEEVISFLSWNVDYLLVGYLLGRKEIGLYWLAFMMAQYLLAIPRNLQAVSYPVFAKLPTEERLRYSFQRSTLYTAVIMLLIALLVIVLGSTLIVTLFGQKWSGAAGALKILVTSVAFRAIFMYWPNYCKLKGYTFLFPLRSILGVGCIVAFGYLMVPRWGITGMAWAVLLSGLITLAIPVLSTRLLFGIDYLRLLARPFLAFVCALLFGLHAYRLLPQYFVVHVFLGAGLVLLYGGLICALDPALGHALAGALTGDRRRTRG
ncbi:MAG: oligosaccharide flippase family protein [Kiritimatiellae bacterium]|nr:oligosaccharide flippase family protein [Kiritimatiellia bacterium]